VVYQLQTTAAAATTKCGAGFAFRKEVDGLRMQRTFDATFAFSSLLTRSLWAPYLAPLPPDGYPPMPACG
jgi:hypothetical protein